MSLFSFLSKKKGSAEETPGSTDMGVPMPSSQETPDIYADLPAFSEKSTGDELLPPLKPILRETSMPGMRNEGPTPGIMGDDQIPILEEGELPVPPQFKYDPEELSPSQPYTVPGIPAVPEEELKTDDTPEMQAPAIPAPPDIEPESENIPSLPETRREAAGKTATGPFIRAYELRQILKDTNDLHASIRVVQDMAVIKQMLDTDAAAYERFHKSVEGLQRKLMLAERMFMKV